MRLGTWNCRLDLDSKRSSLAGLNLDIAVVPESAARPVLAGAANVTHAWRGENANKGLGVFGFGGWTIEPVGELDPLPWCLPVTARHESGPELLLLAVWTVRRQGDGRPSYAGQLAAVIERWRDRIERGEVIIAGDVNASLQGPSVDAHRRNLDLLAELGAHSAFQLANGPVSPEAEPPTLRWIGPGRRPYYYHCDLVFVSQPLAPRLRLAEVGTLAEWVESGLSDHCPVVVVFELPR